MTASDQRFAVVGAGIAGLAAAFELSRRGHVTVWDPQRPGGKLRTGTFAGCRVELGPDAFLTRVPDAVELCTELGMGGSLVAPTTGAAWIVTDSGVHAMPAGLVLGAPKSLGPLARSRLLSPLGLARAGMDLVLPRQRLSGDLPVHELISRRFGQQVAERLVDPLVGGIHAGRAEILSAAATTPQLLAAQRRSRSMMRALRSAPPGGSGPVFLAPSGGFDSLTAALVDHLSDRGTTFRSERATDVRSTGRGKAAVDGELYDGAVVATEAGVAADLLGAEGHPLLRSIPTASVAMVLMSYRATDLPAPPGISGFLVQRATGRLMTAASFASTKWPGWASPDSTLLRVSSGRYGDNRSQDLDDDSLVSRLVEEVGHVLGSPGVPNATQVVRWPASFPQYLVGHLDRVDAIEGHLRASGAPIAVAGSSYRGAGIPACIGSGRRAARLVGGATGDEDDRR